MSETAALAPAGRSAGRCSPRPRPQKPPHSPIVIAKTVHRHKMLWIALAAALKLVQSLNGATSCEPVWRPSSPGGKSLPSRVPHTTSPRSTTSRAPHALRHHGQKVYRSIDELQADLDGWVREYNETRPHQGRWCFGKIPMQTFLDAMPITKEKMIAA